MNNDMNDRYYSDQELMAVFISRQIQDGEFVSVGTNLPVPRAGVLLAHLHHAPNLILGTGDILTNYAKGGRLEAFEFIADSRAAFGAEGVTAMDFETLRRVDLFFVGGVQIDKYGNTNLIGIGKDHRHLKFRGPGGAGTATLTALVKRYFIYTNSHTPRIFVEECDFRSTVGWDKGGADARKKLGFPGGGPDYVITPLCVMDFEEETKRMRLKHLAPHTTVEEVVKNTGFELIIPKVIEPIAAPTEQELDTLRTRVDTAGILRRSG